MSNSIEKTIEKYLKTKKPQDTNILVFNGEVDEKLFGDAFVVRLNELPSVMYEVAYKYSTGKFDKVKVFSSLSIKDDYKIILPMEKFEENYKKDAVNYQTHFFPSTKIIMKKLFEDYLNNVLKYFVINSEYVSLKNSLFKHEKTLENLDTKLDKMKLLMNNIKRTKITEEIILSFREEKNA